MSFGIQDHVAQVRALLEDAAASEAVSAETDGADPEDVGDGEVIATLLRELEGLGDELRGLTRSDIEQVLTAWTGGRPDVAQHLYLATRATYEERRAAAAAADADALAAADQRREAWGRVETVLRGLGAAGVRLALALLRA